MVAAGIDTWSVCWYLDNDATTDHMAVIASRRSGRYSLVPDQVAGHRVVYDRGNRLVWAEGHPVDGQLAPVDAGFLVQVQEAVADGIGDLGVAVPRRRYRGGGERSPGPAGIRRLDLTADLQRTSTIGRAILTGVAALEAPGQLRSTVHRAPDHAIATVTWEGASGKMARTYDKGLESGSHAPGERVRLEDQRRFSASTRVPTEGIHPDYARVLFNRRFSPIWAPKKGLIVTTLGPAADRVQAAVDAGEITPASGYKIIGYLVAEQRGIQLGARMTRYRHRRAARELGLVLADGVVEDLEVDLADETAEAAEVDWAQGSGNAP